MTALDIIEKYISFFEKRGHKRIPNSPLVPENDPTTLFTSSGMQPLVSYLLGEPHALGKRLVNVQNCFRAQDIDEVGDNRHTTFFEMLGDWILGEENYKKEQLTNLFIFLTNDNWLNLDPTRLYFTIFVGDKEANAPKDSESEDILKDLFNSTLGCFYQKGLKDPTVNYNLSKGIEDSDRIFYYGSENNWWSISGTPKEMTIGDIGGPDCEVFYDFDPEGKTIHQGSSFKNQPCHPNCECGRFLEIGNSVFIEFEKNTTNGFKPLAKPSVDFGGGLERLTAATENTSDIFGIDLYKPIVEKICKGLGVNYETNKQSIRVIADHIKASVFLMKDGVSPSNKQQGYVLRRLLRRIATKAFLIDRQKSDSKFFRSLIKPVIDIYPEYFEKVDAEKIEEDVSLEIRKFRATLERGLQQLDKSIKDNENLGLAVFNLLQSYGYPLELTMELLKERGIKFTDSDMRQFEEGKKSHIELSRKLSAGMFKGGLGEQSEIATKYHTATHLLHAALRQILGTHVQQKGSNITSERLRFDFSHPQNLTDEQIKKVEDLVNQKIQENLPVIKEVMDKEGALKSGALGFFTEKYQDKVKVYTIGPSTLRQLADRSESPFSREICGGPHVDFTGRLKRFKIIKQENIGGGNRRIYAKVD